MMYFYEQKQEYESLSEKPTLECIPERMNVCYNTLRTLINVVGTTAFEYMNDEDREFLQICLDYIKDEIYL